MGLDFQPDLSWLSECTLSYRVHLQELLRMCMVSVYISPETYQSNLADMYENC